MTEVRNHDGALVAKIDKNNTNDTTVIIMKRGCETKIKLRKDGEVDITHKKTKLKNPK